MPMKNIPVKFLYFAVMDFYGTGRCDLTQWISRIYNMGLEERLCDVLDTKGRLEDICLVENNQYIALNFMRMDENSNSYIVPQQGKAKHIDLEDDQFMGKNTVALYDPKRCVLLVQCNKGGFSADMIQSYINNIFGGEQPSYRLVPVVSKMDGFFQKKKRKLILTVADLRKINRNNCKSDVFERIVSAAEETGAVTAKIELGMGYEYWHNLNNEAIELIAEDVKKEYDRGTIKKAQFVIKDEERTAVYDLFENLEHDIVYCPVMPRRELKFNQVADKIARRYEESGRVRMSRIN
ncbi:MAG: hypothetical protein Q4C48_08900 [Lachnospiraceae bacterium]|nr:hypothetical protein [Lachnospiraceae bacterium]